ncbi:MAG: DUF4339 domain-containing protein [Bacteroidia bacterium]|nr:DUF4339 domain-containing protein [Bacteroidia bacterium]
MNKIFLFDGKEKTGPFSEEDLKNLYLNKKMRFWYDGMPKWLPIEMLGNATIQNKLFAKPKKIRNYTLIYLMWVFIGIISLFVLLLYTFLFDEFGETELIQFSLYWFGPLVFSITTLISAYSKSNRPLLYGLLAAISGTVFLILFFGIIWSAL